MIEDRNSANDMSPTEMFDIVYQLKKISATIIITPHL
jgi:hypothetical protein